jgi:hypothetical protein
VLNDGKWPTPTIIPMGFRNIPRPAFLDLVGKAVQQRGRDGRWQVELGLEQARSPALRDYGVARAAI